MGNYLYHNLNCKCGGKLILGLLPDGNDGTKCVNCGEITPIKK